MLINSYYRCPIPIEEGDNEYPRFFVLAQVIEYNEMANAVKVKMHDLLGSGVFYGSLFKHDVFFTSAISHCAGMVGGTAEGKFGRGTIAAVVKPKREDDSYWYYIKKPNGEYVKACETELRLDYTQMDYSPAKQMKNYEFQHPSWFINHIKVSKNLHLVNNGSYGFNVLAGCRAYLLPHQVSTITRCLETFPVRYMLADEVGLGKTVEACSILKILRSENNGLRALIIVPGALIGQWKNELAYKYGLMASSNVKDDICIADLESICDQYSIIQGKWDLLIVDETHRLLSDQTTYDTIQTLSTKVPNILLLSATPIQDRNEEYRHLLALLSPDVYKDMPAERFAWLVNKQKSIQQTVNQQLGRLSKFDEYGESIASKLHDIADLLEDNTLLNLISSIDSNTSDKGLVATTQALSYVCENYRLERKVIRNRRQIISEKMARRTLEELTYLPLSADDTYNESGAIQEVLSYLSDNADGSEDYMINHAIPLLSALFSSPWALKGEISRQGITDSRLISTVDTWHKQAGIEHSLVNEALDEDPDLIKGRLMRVLDYIDQENKVATDPHHKIVVFSAFTDTLESFINIFNTRFDQYGVYAVPFSSNMSKEDLEDSVFNFQNDEACRVIVCDETGGEGRNLQNAKQVIHLDLPWNANSLEQRIGRLDRLGRNPDDDVQSVVIYAENSIEEQLFKIWNEGLKLFTHSLSGLEIITGELNSLIVEALLDDIYTGLDNAFEDILDQADEMRESVEDEQLFDIGATLYKPLAHGIDNVLNLYAEENDKIFADAMLGWGRQAGMESEPPRNNGLIEFKKSRFSPNAAKQSLFIPPQWSLYDNTSMMRRTGEILGSFDRGTAALSEDLLFFAPGDAVYDAIISNAAGCSRGRCTAIGIASDFNYDGLIYIFNVDAPITNLIDQKLGVQTLAKYKMYLPLSQIIVTVPLTKTSQNVPEKWVIQAMMNATEHSVAHLGRRSGARGMSSPIENFIQKTPADVWEPLVEKCTIRATNKAMAVMNEQSDLMAAKSEMMRVLNGHKAEALYFGKDMGYIEKLSKTFDETFKALENASPTLDAVCFMRIRKNG